MNGNVMCTLLMALTVFGCPAPEGGSDPCGGVRQIDARGSINLTVGRLEAGDACVWSLVLPGERYLSASTINDSISLRLGGMGSGREVPPTMLPAGTHRFEAVALEALGGAPVVLLVKGTPVNAVEADVSLSWTPAVMQSFGVAPGFEELFGSIGGDEAGAGVVLDGWLAELEALGRATPAGLRAALHETLGPDPSGWDLGEAPLVLTGLHNRIDLARGGHCGELRVTLGSTVPEHDDFFVRFRYRMQARAADVGEQGTHCIDTAFDWAQLSSSRRSPEERRTLMLSLASLSSRELLGVQTMELSDGVWEWRAWEPAGSGLVSVPLQHTADLPRLNEAGSERDAFLTFVEANAAALAARSLEVPDDFWAEVARVDAPEGVYGPLDLGAMDVSEHPDLAGQIALQGCPACHTADAPFVHVEDDGARSPMLQKELAARAIRLVRLQRGQPQPEAPYGPRQPGAVLP